MNELLYFFLRHFLKQKNFLLFSFSRKNFRRTSLFFDSEWVFCSIYWDCGSQPVFGSRNFLPCYLAIWWYPQIAPKRLLVSKEVKSNPKIITLLLLLSFRVKECTLGIEIYKTKAHLKKKKNFGTFFLNFNRQPPKKLLTSKLVKMNTRQLLVLKGQTKKVK